MQPFLVNQNIIHQYSRSPESHMTELAAIHRINCLAGLKAANHGWLGASFSCIEILTTIYHRFVPDPTLPIQQRGSVHLSKGHAAMAHYSVLASLGCFPVEKLLSYKQLNGLPAHCDREIAGVDSDSGSLGQGLSKAIGIAVSNRNAGFRFPVFALIGDGELQEGQLFEAFLTLKKLNPGCCIPIIDRNMLQSDSQTSDIKDAENWAMVFRGIGLEVLEIDGHDPDQIYNAINALTASRNAGVIIAKTFKGGGTSLTSMSPDTSRRQGIWHGQIPDDIQYAGMLTELVNSVNCPVLGNELDAYLKHAADAPAESRTTEFSSGTSTGQAFADALVELAGDDRQVYVLDADLEKSCRLTKAAEKFADRFLEIGISEQDMCSIAAGLGLNGRIAVVNTYASFYKRSIDQIATCVNEGVPVIFAGHYAGADYFTDGKSHQSINDIGLMRSLGNIEIYEPIDAIDSLDLLKSCLSRLKHNIEASNRSCPAYFRLHRTPETSFAADQNCDGYKVFHSGIKDTAKLNRIFTSGPHMLKTCLEAARILCDEGIALEVIAVTRFADENNNLKKLIESSHRFFTFEDHLRETGLGSFIAGLSIRNPVKIGIRRPAHSALSFSEMLEYHNLCSSDIIAVVKKVLSCIHEK